MLVFFGKFCNIILESNLCVPSKFFSTATDGYIHPWCALPAPTLSALHQPKTYIYVLLHFACDQNTFMPATRDVYIRPSGTSPAANDVYIRPNKVTFYRYLVVGCVFLWLLSYIYKPLDIIEIMSNCNTNSQRRMYTSILQGFSKTLVAEVYIEIHMLQTKSLHARGKSTL